MIIILYTNSDYNNTLYYMLLEIQLKQEQMDGLLKSTLQGKLQQHLMIVIILYYLLFFHQVSLDSPI